MGHTALSVGKFSQNGDLEEVEVASVFAIGELYFEG